MQMFINKPDEVVDDMLMGYVKNHRDLISKTANPRVLKYKSAPIKNKVGIVTGGGSGHKPAFIGYIGKNLVDAVAVGEIFSSPTAKDFYDAFKAANSGKGVACLFGNYAGDIMNVKMAIEMAKEDNIEVKTVIANDDVPSASKKESDKRRGVAGEILMWKIGGAKASQGVSLDKVIQTSQKAIDNTKSIGIGLSPCTIPEVGKPNFTIEEGKMEVGIGHHGEPGIKVTNIASADEIAKTMVDTVLPDLPFKKSDEVVVLLSGLGATPVMELYILFSKIFDILENEQEIKVYKSYVGNYFTSLDMKGATLTVMKLDQELKGLIDVESNSMGLKQFKE